MATRKTVFLADMLESVNHKNRASTCSAEVREGWNSLLEEMLMKADAYAGYGYLSAGDVPAGHKPGSAKDEAGKNIFPDESRRFYYVHAKLTK